MGKKQRKKQKKSNNKLIRIGLLVILLLLIMMLWSRFIIGFALTAVFAISTFLILQFSVKLEYIDISTYMATSCFMGYVFGPWTGLLYALFVGGISYGVLRFSFNSISIVTITTVYAVVCGILGNTYNLIWSTAFIITVFAKIITSAIWFYILTSNMVRIVGIFFSQLVVNIFLYLPLLGLLLKLITPLL